MVEAGKTGMDPFGTGGLGQDGLQKLAIGRPDEYDICLRREVHRFLRTFGNQDAYSTIEPV